MTTFLLLAAVFLTAAVVYTRAHKRWGFGLRAELATVGAALVILFIVALALGTTAG